MDSRWYKGFSGAAKATREKNIKGHKNAFDDLSEVLEKSFTPDPTVSDYNDPSWAYKRADLDGYNRAVQQIIKLINVKG